MGAIERLAKLMADPSVVRVARGTFSVTAGEGRELVYVAGPPGDRWAFWNGYVFHSTGDAERQPSRPAGARGAAGIALTAPMPATVITVLVAPGARVSKGEALVVLEAMKMEWPIRALGDGTVKAVRCREGEIVQADQTLVELE